MLARLFGCEEPYSTGFPQLFWNERHAFRLLDNNKRSAVVGGLLAKMSSAASGRTVQDTSKTTFFGYQKVANARGFHSFGIFSDHVMQAISRPRRFQCAIPPQTGFTAESGGSIA